MSKETNEWLRSNIRIGYTTQDGPAWWAATDHMADGSHFEGPVPADIARKLLSVPLVEAKLNPVYEYGGQRGVADASDRKGIVRADTGQLLGVFKSGYEIHQYEEWTLQQIANLLDTGAGQLGIKSAGLLKRGAQAWLQVRLAETFTVGGFGYVPFIGCATSCDGSLASTPFVGIDAAVCDNTLSMAIANAVHKVRIRHTSKSQTRIGEVRDALGLVYQAAEDFDTAASELMAITVTPDDFAKWLDMEAPLPAKASPAKDGRGYTVAASKRAALTGLWSGDAKVAPWKGTAFGVAQLANTWRTWSQTVQGADGGRMERFYSNMVLGKTEAADTATMAQLSKVLGRDLVAA